MGMVDRSYFPDMSNQLLQSDPEETITVYWVWWRPRLCACYCILLNSILVCLAGFVDLTVQLLFRLFVATGFV